MALIVKISSKKDEKFLAELLAKLGYSTASIESEELEDFAFGQIMKTNNESDVLTLREAKAEYKRSKRKK